MIKIYLLFIACSFSACVNNNKSATTTVEKETPVIPFTVAAEFPHDKNAFTEGFIFHEGVLFESTGSPEGLPESESVAGPVDLKTGKINVKIKLDKNVYFGEGIAFLNHKLFQLTYKNQTCFVYDAKTFKKIGSYQFSNKEGWGLTTDGTQIIMSDGTDVLSYVNPDNFQITKTLQVSENGFAVQNLNELEFIDGYLYANIWTTNNIVKIDPSNGKVVGKLDLGSLKNQAVQRNPEAAETNGIAFDAATKKVYVTGKLWRNIYQIEFAR
jgi:glutamine cyclotransferase